jgi:hypothetical protein
LGWSKGSVGSDEEGGDEWCGFHFKVVCIKYMD